MNGRRTPDADQNVKGAVAGLTLGTSAPEIFRALVEATAFGSRRIVEHMKGQGLRIDSVNAIGGISKKAPFVMQTLADVLDMPIRVVRSEQTCALGAAMFAAVAAGVYKDINEATRHMGSDIEAEYRPDEKRASSTKNYTRNILNWQNLLKPLTKYINQLIYLNHENQIFYLSSLMYGNYKHLRSKF